ncbi:MAG: hypothetical protein ACO3LN_02230 [bacterium]
MLVGLLNLGDVGTTHIRKPPKSKFYFWFLVFGWNIKEGVGIRVLAERAGHASLQTAQRYVDVNDDMMWIAAELIRSESC